MQFKSKYNKGIRFLLCEIDLFSKYAWVITIKDKKGISINAFQKILAKLKRKKKKKKLGLMKVVTFAILSFKGF